MEFSGKDIASTNTQGRSMHAVKDREDSLFLRHTLKTVGAFD